MGFRATKVGSVNEGLEGSQAASISPCRAEEEHRVPSLLTEVFRYAKTTFTSRSVDTTTTTRWTIYVMGGHSARAGS